jgi:hypothetical protein
MGMIAGAVGWDRFVHWCARRILERKKMELLKKESESHE